MALPWLLGVVPAAVVTAWRGRWLYFWAGWLTLGLLWFIGALGQDPDAPPRDPRWVLAAVAVVAAMFVLGLFGARPAPVLGLDGAALQSSVGNSSLMGSDSCRPAGDEWMCSRWDSQFSGTVPYRVDVDGVGCWRAVRVGGGGEGGSEKTLSGCATLVDFL